MFGRFRESKTTARGVILRNLVLVAPIFFFASLADAAPIYYLSTGQPGAQTQIDVNHTSTWSIAALTPFELGGGVFTMKGGSAVSATIQLALYQGTDATGTLLASTTLTSTTFCGQSANCGQFAFHQFFFTTPILLSVGTNYFAALTSSAVDTQSQAYFIKSDASSIADANGTPIDPPPGTFTPGAASDVPEPQSLAIGAIGLALIGIGRLSRRGIRSRL